MLTEFVDKVLAEADYEIVQTLIKLGLICLGLSVQRFW